jgi:predicted nucleic acid-binding protein
MFYDGQSLISLAGRGIEPNQRISVAKDPDDNIILKCAVAGQVDYLVTGNLRHFPKSIRQIPIVSPRQFLDNYLRSIAEDEI